MITFSTSKPTRLSKALDRTYTFPGYGTMKLREFWKYVKVTKKTTFVREWSTRRINLSYKKINPKTHYTVWYLNESGREFGIDVPKVVWESLVIL